MVSEMISDMHIILNLGCKIFEQPTQILVREFLIMSFIHPKKLITLPILNMASWITEPLNVITKITLPKNIKFTFFLSAESKSSKD